MVSHDRYFLNRVCTGILAFEGEGKIFQQVGNYDYYLDKKTERTFLAAQSQAAALPESASKNSSTNSLRPKKLSYKESRELEGMEETLLAAEDEVARIESLFNAPNFYEKFGDRWESLDAELKAGRHKVAQLYARGEQLEALKTNAEN